MTEPLPFGHTTIQERLDVALEKARFQRLTPARFYLTDEDQAVFNAAESRDWGSELVALSWRDVPIVKGQTSRLYCKGGIGIAVPKRLSRRVAA